VHVPQFDFACGGMRVEESQLGPARLYRGDEEAIARMLVDVCTLFASSFHIGGGERE
jgi:hypothetical protein